MLLKRGNFQNNYLLMKKLLSIIVLGLLLSGNAYAVTLSCTDNIVPDFSSDMEFSRIEIIIDSNGSVHITESSTYVPRDDVLNEEYSEKVWSDKSVLTDKEKKEFHRAHMFKFNPLIKNPNDGIKSEKFTSMAFKAGNKIKTQLIIRDPTATDLVFADYYEIDLSSKEIKKFLTVTPESRAWWNSNWDEERAKQDGIKKIGAPDMLKHYINCTTGSDNSSSDDVASSGSGFFINNKGYFVTNNHVVKGCKQSKITFKEKEVDAELIATDETLDLALLRAKVKPKDYLNISDEPPEKMQKVFVAGYPFGKYLSDDMKFTSGIVSSLKGLGDDSTRLQIDAALNRGNSGGPIVDENTGELVAVAVAGLRKDKTEAVNFGIKAASVKNFLQSNQIDTTLLKKRYSRAGVASLLESTTMYTFCN